MQKDNIIVEVVYATAQQQELVRVELKVGGLVSEAIEISCLLDKYPEINLINNKVGIFGRLCSLDVKLCNGDRVEIYRPLLIDPMEARRITAIRSKKIQVNKF